MSEEDMDPLNLDGTVTSVQVDFMDNVELAQQNLSPQKHAGKELEVESFDGKNENQKSIGNDGQENNHHMCNSCGKNFALQKELKRHLRRSLHRHYKCEICERTFSQIGNLNKHKCQPGKSVRKVEKSTFIHEDQNGQCNT